VQLADALTGLLTDIGFLEAKTARFGMDALLADVRDAGDLVPADAKLRATRRTLEREAHHLRRWRPGEEPAFFTQQLHNRAIDLAAGDLAVAARRRLDYLGEPRVELLWRAAGDQGSPDRTLAGHDFWVECLAISSDGSRLASGSLDKTVRIWDLATGRELHTLTGHEGGIQAVAMSADARRLVSGSYDCTAKVWDTDTGQELHTFGRHTSPVVAVFVTPDCRVVSADEETVRVWELETGRECHVLAPEVSDVTPFGDKAPIEGLTVTPDGSRAISHAYAQTLRVWDVVNGRELHKLVGHEDGVTAVAVTTDGRYAVSGSLDGTLQVWDLDAGRSVHRLRHGEWIRAVAIAGDSKRALSYADHDRVIVWDIERGRSLRRLPPVEGAVEALAVTPNGRAALSVSSDRILRLWDLETGTQLSRFAQHDDSVRALALTSDSRHAVSAAGDTLRVWSLERGDDVPEMPAGHAGAVTGVALCSLAFRGVSTSEDATLKVWDVQSGREIETIAGDGNPIRAVAITSDCGRAVSAAYDELSVWDLKSGRRVLTMSQPLLVVAVVVTPDNSHVISASDETLCAWNLETAERLAEVRLDHPFLTVFAATLDGRRALETPHDGKIRVWDLETGRKVTTLTQRSGVNALAVMPDGRAVIGSSDGLLTLREVETGAELEVLAGHDTFVSGIAVSADGRRAVSISSDRTIKCWDMDEYTCWATARLEREMSCLSISADGGLIFTGDGAGNVYCFRAVEP
jgi:WD40 repeat protein